MGESKSWLRRVIEAEPVIIRGAIVSVLGFVAMTANWNLSEGFAELVVSSVISVFALISAVWSRSAVVPAKKVVAYMPSPSRHPELVKPGEANDSIVSGDYRPGHRFNQ